MAFWFAVVGGQGADEAVGRQLLGDVGGPAGESGGDEDRREGWRVEADQVVGRARGIVQVGVQPLASNMPLATIS